MAASREEISRWFDEGVADGKDYMLVVCDTFDWDDYPVFETTDTGCLIEYHRLHNQNMQRVMEVYDLRKPKAEQIAAFRVWNLPSATTGAAAMTQLPEMGLPEAVAWNELSRLAGLLDGIASGCVAPDYQPNVTADELRQWAGTIRRTLELARKWEGGQTGRIIGTMVCDDFLRYEVHVEGEHCADMGGCYVRIIPTARGPDHAP